MFLKCKNIHEKKFGMRISRSKLLYKHRVSSLTKVQYVNTKYLQHDSIEAVVLVAQISPLPE